MDKYIYEIVRNERSYKCNFITESVRDLFVSTKLHIDQN